MSQRKLLRWMLRHRPGYRTKLQTKWKLEPVQDLNAYYSTEIEKELIDMMAKELSGN